MVMIPDLDSNPHPLDELLRHAAWTRRLARGLIGDDSRAEDVAPGVGRPASRGAPRAPEPLQRWLRAIGRNRVFNLTRERRRRQAREARVDAPPATESAE